MGVFAKCIVIAVLLLLGLTNAQAGQCGIAYHCAKHRHTGMSFSVTFGVKVIARPHTHLRRPVLRGCTPRQASRIASHRGIRYQTIYRNSQIMTVIGYKKGHRAQIRISRTPNCRIIR